MNNVLIKADMRRIFLEAVILGILAFAVGLSLNFSMVFNAFSGKTVTSGVGNQTQMQNQVVLEELLPLPVMLEELDSLLGSGAILVDARSSSAYREAHLQGAVSLPLGQAQDGIAGLKADVPLETTLIVYCSGFGCPDSFDLGVLLLQAGYSDVLVYEGGFPEWKDAGRPLGGEGD